MLVEMLLKVILPFHTQIPVDGCKCDDFRCINILQMKHRCMFERKAQCFGLVSWSACVLTSVCKNLNLQKWYVLKWTVYSRVFKRFISNMQSFVAAWHRLLWSSVIYLKLTVENGPDRGVKDNGMLNCKRKCYVKKWAYPKIALEFLSSSVFWCTENMWSKNKYLQNVFSSGGGTQKNIR